MLLNDKIIFLQLQKTAGTYLESKIFEIFPETKQAGKHYRLSKDFKTDGRYVLGSIRNPWDWYLSYWTYSCQKKGGPYLRSQSPKSIKNMYLGDRRNNCNDEVPYSTVDLYRCIKAELTRPVEEWKYVYGDVEDPARFKKWLNLVFDPKRKYDLFPDFGLSSVSNFSGIYTYLFLFLFVEDFESLFDEKLNYSSLSKLDFRFDKILRVESLDQDFTEFLNSINVDNSIDNNIKINSSNRRHHRDYYFDDESIALIAEKEKFIINMFDYRY